MFGGIIAQLKNVKWEVLKEDFSKLPEDVRLKAREFLLWILKDPKA